MILFGRTSFLELGGYKGTGTCPEETEPLIRVFSLAGPISGLDRYLVVVNSHRIAWST